MQRPARPSEPYRNSIDVSARLCHGEDVLAVATFVYIAVGVRTVLAGQSPEPGCT